jgi:hypothetical protein
MKILRLPFRLIRISGGEVTFPENARSDLEKESDVATIINSGDKSPWGTNKTKCPQKGLETSKGNESRKKSRFLAVSLFSRISQIRTPH